MRLLAVDPGAERCGWAIVETGPKLLDSDVMRYPRNDREFQPYRLALEAFTAYYFDGLLGNPDLRPGKVVTETVPAVGGGNFAVATQSYLANCVATVIHVCAFKRGLEVAQIGARTFQSKIAIRGRSKGITKVQVRNGVVHWLPELKARVKDLVADESDAIAIGLCSLGYVTK